MNTALEMERSDLHPRLRRLFSEKKSLTGNGEEVGLSSAITAENASRLTQVVRESGAARAIEIGMAHGVSSISILHGMNPVGSMLTSVDPFQSSQWQGCGVRIISDEGFANRHQLLEQMNWFALPDLLRERRRFDFAYIDGDHSFACTFLDFFYLDKMLEVGGIIGFNDCGMRSVQRVVSYLKANLEYEQVHEVKISWWSRRRMKFWEYPDMYFRKRNDVSVPWDKYADF